MDKLGYLPTELIAGASIWVSASNTQNPQDIVLADFAPSDGSTLQYKFDSRPTVATVSAVANSGNTGWTLTVAASTTAAWRSGSVRFYGYITTSAGIVVCVDAGAIMVYAAPGGTSWADDALTAIEAAIEGRASDSQSNFQIGDLSVGYMSVDQLFNMRDKLRAEIKRDGAGRVKRIIHSRFT